MRGAKRSADPICSGCYSGLLPVVDHLRSLSARGHAFHEPCIQHLFASCWKEEISYCPVSKANVRRVKSHSVANTCHCGETLEELRQGVKQLKGSVARMYSARKSAAKWSRRYRQRETMRRLHDTVMRLQSKVMRLEHMQKDRADVTKKVPLKRKPCDAPSIGSNVGIFNQYNKLPVVEPVKLGPTKRYNKVSDNLKAEEHAFGSIFGNLGPSKRNKKGSDNLKADYTLETEPPLGSISTTDECIDTDDPYSVRNCLAIINGMQGLDPRLDIAAQDLFEDPNWRKIFVSLKREKRLTWLISMLPGV